jgi:hypothetical protein
MAKLSNKQLLLRLKQLGLVIGDKTPITYTAFKNRATIAGYKRGDIILIGIPKKNLFGFYVPRNKHPEMMKDAYKRFEKLVNGKMTDYEDKVIQWGNAGVPLDYLDLRIDKRK